MVMKFQQANPWHGAKHNCMQPEARLNQRAQDSMLGVYLHGTCELFQWQELTLTSTMYNLLNLKNYLRVLTWRILCSLNVSITIFVALYFETLHTSPKGMQYFLSPISMRKHIWEDSSLMHRGSNITWFRWASWSSCFVLWLQPMSNLMFSTGQNKTKQNKTPFVKESKSWIRIKYSYVTNCFSTHFSW